MRGKQLVKRRDKARRDLSELSGVRTMCACLLLREQVIKPLLAGVQHRLGHPPKTRTPRDQHYLNLRPEMNRTLEKPLAGRPEPSATHRLLGALCFWISD